MYSWPANRAAYLLVLIGTVVALVAGAPEGASGVALMAGTGDAPQADLSVTKSDDADPVKVGDDIDYTVVVTNDGPDAAENVEFADTLPSGTTFSYATVSQGTCAIAFPLLTCQFGTLASGGSVTLRIHVRADVAGTVTNTVSVDSDTDDPDPSDNKYDPRNLVGKPAAGKPTVPYTFVSYLNGAAIVPSWDSINVKSK